MKHKCLFLTKRRLVKFGDRNMSEPRQESRRDNALKLSVVSLFSLGHTNHSLKLLRVVLALTYVKLLQLLQHFSNTDSTVQLFIKCSSSDPL